MIIRIFGEGQYELSDPRGLPAEARAGATARVYLRRCVAADGCRCRAAPVDNGLAGDRSAPGAVVADVIPCSRIRPRSITSSESSTLSIPSRHDAIWQDE